MPAPRPTLAADAACRKSARTPLLQAVAAINRRVLSPSAALQHPYATDYTPRFSSPKAQDRPKRSEQNLANTDRDLT